MPSMYILPISTYDVPSGESDPLIADFSVMKLEKEREPRLRITDRTGTVRYHDFTIEISFNNYLPISIKINGWEVVVEEI